MGVTQRQTVAILYCISGIMGVSAVVMTVSGEIKAILLLFAVIIAAVFGIMLIAKRERKPEDPENERDDASAAPENEPDDAGGESPADRSGEE